MLDVAGDLTINARTWNGWTADSENGFLDANLCIVLNGAGSVP